MATKNSSILGKFYLSGTTDTQQRLSNPTQGSIRKTVQQLFNPMNGDLYNQFMDFMVQRIGYAYARQQKFENPLRDFIKQKIYFGSSVSETALNWIKGHSYDGDAETQFKTSYPDGLQAFHSLDYRMQYPISISKEQMRQAVADEYGLNQLVSAIMAQPMNADQYDIFNAMLNLFTEADVNYDLFRHNLTAAPVDKDGCTEMLAALRQYSYDLTVPSSLYSCSDIPVFANRDELVLFIRSDVMAATDVNTLASVFNLDKADIPYRTQVIPVGKWPLKDTDYAVLTTADFFQCYPVEYSITSQWDPQGLKTNYWLNDWMIISFSPFVPVIVFSTDGGTAVETVAMTPTALAIAGDETAEAGSKVALTLTLSGTITPDGEHGAVEVAPDAATFYVMSTNSDGVAKELNSRTYVDANGVLHLQKTGLAKGDKVIVGAVSTYIDPATLEPGDFKDTHTITIA